MFCMKCGAPLPDGAKFCFKCGCDLRNLSQRTGSYSAVKVGDYVKFGCYPQNNGGVKEPIEWLVLEVRGNNALLISRYGLDCKQYHCVCADMIWENCDLRKWLNGEFLRNAFTVTEQKKIALAKLANDNNAEFGILGGNSTEDRVFCLSMAEAESLFKDNEVRKCVPTPYAVREGAWQSKDDFINGRACCFWWLRSPGFSQYNASSVCSNGMLNPAGPSVGYDDIVVRPALWANL